MKLNKKVTTIVSLALIGAATVVGTVAYLFTSTGPVTNTFAPANVTTEIVEEIDGNVKKTVQIQNSGNVNAYIRAQVVATWQDASGNVHPTKPVFGRDYTYTLNSTGWDVETSDGFYYHKESVAAGAYTSVLFSEGKVLTNTVQKPEGEYFLSIEIIGSGIQADGVEGTTPAVVNAWGVTYDATNKTISK